MIEWGLPLALTLLLAALSICVTFQDGDCRTTLVKGVRHWTAPDHTRIVVDLSDEISYEVKEWPDPWRVFFEFKAARLDFRQTTFPVGDGLVKRIRVNHLRGDRIQVVADLENRARFRHFHLPPYKHKPHRLVLDIYRDVPTEAAPRQPTPWVPGGVVVVLDPGHGGEDPGAVGNALKEKDVTLDVARRIGKILSGRTDFRVVMTRTGDYFMSLADRREAASQANGSLFVSIHCNANRSRKVRGTEVYFLSITGATDEASRELAEMENAADLVGGVPPESTDDLVSILIDMRQTGCLSRSSHLADTMMSELARSKHVSARKVKQARFVVLKNLEMPAVLVELGFISNESDARQMKSKTFRQETAQALADAIVEFAARDILPQLISQAADESAREGDNFEPKTELYTVRAGDTLWDIAKKHGTTVADLCQINGLQDSNRLLVGQKIRVPTIGGGGRNPRSG